MHADTLNNVDSGNARGNMCEMPWLAKSNSLLASETAHVVGVRDGALRNVDSGSARGSMRETCESMCLRPQSEQDLHTLLQGRVGDDYSQG